MQASNSLRERERASEFYGRSAGIRTRGNAAILNHLKKGLPLRHFEKLHKSMALTSIELARTARISLPTLHRRKERGRMQPEESERIFRIASVSDKAVDVLGNQQFAREWFHTPIPALAMKSPLEYADMELGRREIEHVLGRIEHGIFS